MKKIIKIISTILLCQCCSDERTVPTEEYIGSYSAFNNCIQNTDNIDISIRMGTNINTLEIFNLSKQKSWVTANVLESSLEIPRQDFTTLVPPGLKIDGQAKFEGDKLYIIFSTIFHDLREERRSEYKYCCTKK